ncbi:putative quinate permease [Podospora aff. communis PSN243]|uniref:Quinate permease n=1 Tax=Podospora aff. communis PSN243 TaxID=3040156 RepID=A0AAV9GMZ5_9PEZI|nr:putative quinate permease [Podospora aff. communis PSN243]
MPTGKITDFSKASWRLHYFCLFLALGSFVWGYNVGVLASVLVHPGFKKALGSPDSSKNGLITAVYYIGTWLSYMFLAHPAADRLGRRYAALVGTSVMFVGQGLQASANGAGALVMVLIGRVVSGVGTGVISTSVPLYQSEVAPPKHRGRFVVMNHVGFVAGLASGFWVGYAVTFWNDERGQTEGWRFSIAASLIPAFLFLIGLPFMYDSPRWLVEHGHNEEALKTLRYYREGYYSSDEIHTELGEIKQSVAAFKASGLTWISLFTDRSLFARLWRSSLLQFMAQMCGATAMKYYLPALFEALGLSHRVSLLAGGIESTMKIGCTLVDMLIIDRVGRRITLTAGAAVMAVSMWINGALPQLYPDNTNRVADYVCVVFVFIYSFGYSMGFGSAAWVYGSEIFPTAIRARGLSFAASGGAVGSVLVSQIWPVGIRQYGSRIYYFFMAVNLVCVPIIWILYPETKGRPLEDMDVLFGGAPSVSMNDLSDRGSGESQHDETARLRLPRNERGED